MAVLLITSCEMLYFPRKPINKPENIIFKDVFSTILIIRKRVPPEKFLT